MKLSKVEGQVAKGNECWDMYNGDLPFHGGQDVSPPSIYDPLGGVEELRGLLNEGQRLIAAGAPAEEIQRVTDRVRQLIGPPRE